MQCVSLSNSIIGSVSLFLWVKNQIKQRMMIMMGIAVNVKLNMETVQLASIPR